MNVRNAAREADNSARIKKMLKTRIPDYVDRFYDEGDRVFIKDRHSDVWNGPFTVKHHENKSVVIRKDNSEVSVPTNRVIPETLDEGSEKLTDNKIGEQESVNPDDKDECPTPVEMRPKKGKEVKFRTSTDKNWKEGTVVDVGKASGKDKNRCWIKDEKNEINHYDFST